MLMRCFDSNSCELIDVEDAILNEKYHRFGEIIMEINELFVSEFIFAVGFYMEYLSKIIIKLFES